MSFVVSDDVERILKERAEQLAGRQRTAQQRQVLLEVIVVNRGGVVLGLPIKSTREVRRVRVVKMPGASPIDGLFQVRGECHCLFDVHSYFSKSAPALEHGDTVLVVILKHRERTLGVRIDEVIGPRNVHEDELFDDQERHLDVVSHVTRDVLNIIDVERLYKRLGATLT